jgi:gliding motility-associated protein GldC
MSFPGINKRRVIIMSKKSEIKIHIELDENKMPEKLEWEATDAGFNGRKTAKTLMLSLWDKEEKVTLGIDLWTKEMMVEDMNLHFHQMFLKMADTYERATQNAEAANMIRNFSSDFAKKVELKSKE